MSESDKTSHIAWLKKVLIHLHQSVYSNVCSTLFLTVFYLFLLVYLIFKLSFPDFFSGELCLPKRNKILFKHFLNNVTPPTFVSCLTILTC